MSKGEKGGVLPKLVVTIPCPNPTRKMVKVLLFYLANNLVDPETWLSNQGGAHGLSNWTKWVVLPELLDFVGESKATVVKQFFIDRATATSWG